MARSRATSDFTRLDLGRLATVRFHSAEGLPFQPERASRGALRVVEGALEKCLPQPATCSHRRKSIIQVRCVPHCGTARRACGSKESDSVFAFPALSNSIALLRDRNRTCRATVSRPALAGLERRCILALSSRLEGWPPHRFDRIRPVCLSPRFPSDTKGNGRGYTVTVVGRNARGDVLAG